MVNWHVAGSRSYPFRLPASLMIGMATVMTSATIARTVIMFFGFIIVIFFS